MSVERRGPAICNASDIGEGKDEMTKASIDLQDLRRRIYVKAKAEPSWRFWGLYVHVCKMETLRAAYEMAKQNDGAPGVDGVTFEAIEELSPNLGDGLRDQAAAVWDCEDAGLAATSIPSVNLTPSMSLGNWLWPSSRR